MNDVTRVIHGPRRAGRPAARTATAIIATAGCLTRRPAWPRTARTGLAVVATAGLSLLAAACGGTSGSHVAEVGSTATQTATVPRTGAVAFSRCMRSHGVQKFPDPVTGGGRLPKVSLEGLGVSGSQFNAADRACLPLLPAVDTTSMRSDSVAVERCIVGGICPPPVTRWLLNLELRYARCMRAHGIGTWPDPTTDHQGRVKFDVSVAWAASPPDPAHSTCERLTGAPIG